MSNKIKKAKITWTEVLPEMEVPTLPSLDTLKFYVIRNSEGKYFRRKGYQGHGDTWTDDVFKIRIHTKIGPARAIVSFFANQYPAYPIPELLEINTGTITVLDETERINKARQKKMTEDTKQEEYRAKEQLKDAERDLKQAQERLSRLRK